MKVAWALATVMLIGTPAAACSLLAGAEPPSSEGDFRLYNASDERSWDLKIGSLGGDTACGLTLRPSWALSGEWFVFPRQGVLFALDIEAGHIHEKEYSLGRVDGMGIGGDALIVPTRVNETTGGFTSIDLRTGETTSSPGPAWPGRSDQMPLKAEGSLLYFQDRGTAEQEVSVFDAATDRWLVRDEPVSSLAMHPNARLLAVDAQGLLFIAVAQNQGEEERDREFIFRHWNGSQDSFIVPPDHRYVAIDPEAIWFVDADGHLAGRLIEDGAGWKHLEMPSSAPRDIVAVYGPLILGRTAWQVGADDEDLLPIAGPAFGLSVAGLALMGAAVALRRRQECDDAPPPPYG